MCVVNNSSYDLPLDSHYYADVAYMKVSTRKYQAMTK